MDEYLVVQGTERLCRPRFFALGMWIVGDPFDRDEGKGAVREPLVDVSFVVFVRRTLLVDLGPVVQPLLVPR
jgi:hypothetical protein